MGSGTSEARREASMKVAVTGASGLVGGQVCRAAAEAGHDVRGVVRRSGVPEGVEPAHASLEDPAALRQAFTGCEAVVHCAAVYAFEPDRQDEVERVNTAGTAAVVEAAADAGVRRVVVTSSSVTCGSSATATPRTERDE